MVAEYLLTRLTPSTPITSYLTNNTLGSPRIITDSSGSVISRRDFMPFGEEISAIGGRTSGLGYQVDATRQKFTSYERDNETNLDFAQARMYSSKIGRFMNADQPFNDQFEGNPQSWSLYSYVRNNPLKFTDPFGMAADCPPGSPEGCYEKDGKYYTKDENGNEIEYDPIPLTIPSPDSGKTSSPTMALLIPMSREASESCKKFPIACEPMFFPVPLGPVAHGGKSIISRVFTWLGEKLFGRVGAEFANGVTRAALQAAANDAGPTIKVVTNLTNAPQAGRALSVAVGDGAEGLAATARNGGRIFTANIPKALVETLRTAGLVTESTTMMGGVKGTELAFRPEAAEFIVKFFH